jgi:hypothetical protein
MRLRWEMMEPTFARRAAAASAAEGDSPAASATPRGFTRAEEFACSAGALGVALAVVALYAAVAFHLTEAAATVAFSLVPFSLAALVVIPEVRRSSRRTAITGNAVAVIPRGRVAPAALRRALGQAAPRDGRPWTRPERLYGEVVTLLLADDEDDFPLPALEERRRRDLLRQCNTLLATGRRLSRRRAALTAALPPGADEWAADAEGRTLAARLEAEDDPAARAALRESLEMASDRAESLRALRPVIARLDAQEESVCQALLLARAALLHQQAAPAALATMDTSAGVAALRQSLRQITHDARAACDAAAEVSAGAAGEIAAVERRAAAATVTPAEGTAAVVANGNSGAASSAPPSP